MRIEILSPSSELWYIYAINGLALRSINGERRLCHAITLKRNNSENGLLVYPTIELSPYIVEYSRREKGESRDIIFKRKYSVSKHSNYR